MFTFDARDVPTEPTPRQRILRAISGLGAEEVEVVAVICERLRDGQAQSSRRPRGFAAVYAIATELALFAAGDVVRARLRHDTDERPAPSQPPCWRTTGAGREG